MTEHPDPFVVAAKQSRSPGAMARRLEARARLLDAIAGRLRGSRELLVWNNGEGINQRRILRELGVVLVTKTKAKKLGCRLKRGVAPAASHYHNAPISAYCDLFVLGVQTVPIEVP